MRILGVRVDCCVKRELANKIADCLVGSKKTKIFKINTEFLQRAMTDERFSEVLNNSDINIVDGRGVLWAARYLTLPIVDGFWRFIQAWWQMMASGAKIVFKPSYIAYPIPEAIPGVEAFYLMLGAAMDAKASVFIFGSSQSTLDLALVEIRKKLPELKIAGSLNGYDFQADDKIDPVEVINQTDAKLLIVALGSPRQEYWINDNIAKLNNIRVAVGEGGTLDRVANPSQKAPKLVNKIGLEWLWRLFFNKNMTGKGGRFKRVWNSVPKFIYKTVIWKVQYGQTEIQD